MRSKNGLKHNKNCNYCDKYFEVHPCFLRRKYCSKKCGYLARIGRSRPEHEKLKISESMKGMKANNIMRGSDNPRWKGGISSENEIIRGSLESRTWQNLVKKRDNFCCQKCKEGRIRYLTAHHILNFSEYVELRFEIDNGITLCRPCHKEFHMKYKFRNNTLEQLEEFLNKKWEQLNLHQDNLELTL